MSGESTEEPSSVYPPSGQAPVLYVYDTYYKTRFSMNGTFAFDVLEIHEGNRVFCIRGYEGEHERIEGVFTGDFQDPRNALPAPVATKNFFRKALNRVSVLGAIFKVNFRHRKDLQRARPFGAPEVALFMSPDIRYAFSILAYAFFHRRTLVLMHYYRPFSRITAWFFRLTAGMTRLQPTAEHDELGSFLMERMGCHCPTLHYPAERICAFAAARGPRSAPGRALTIGFFGNHRAEKGLDILLEAVRFLDEAEIPDYRFLIQGEQAVIEEKFPFLATIGSGIIEWLPPKLFGEPYFEALYGCDAVMLPYRLEPYRLRLSMVAVEAGILGIPICASRGLSTDFLRAYTRSWLEFEEGDPEELKDCLERLRLGYSHWSGLAREDAPKMAEAFGADRFTETLNRLRVKAGLVAPGAEEPEEVK